MNAEIIAVGSELLLGQINNTNARFISSQLTELGIHIYHHTVVGDNPRRLLQAIEIAESRADIIIFSGGLGPTKDDLTKETIAQHLGVNLVQDDQTMASIQHFFDVRNRVMTDNNKKQALVLDGATVLTNRHGMAPGMLYETDKHFYMLLPGPPSELEPMFQFEAKPLLASIVSDGEQIVSQVLHFYGIGESALEVEVSDLLDLTNPTVAPLASDGEVMLRITAQAESEIRARELIEPIQQEILQRVGKHFYGINDDSLSSKLVEMLIDNKLTIAAAESLTAGRFMATLADIPGVGEALQGGVVVYNEEMKIKQLDISRELLEEYTVVSSQCAEAMALSAREKFDADIGVGLTGAAGPDAHDGSPAGTVWIGIAIKDTVHTYKLQLSAQRNTNRLLAVKACQNFIIQLLSEQGYSKLKNS
ncbi:MAG TPA: competence/damage-inducible protein A [Candidatus Kurthia intestinigallinarum]|nr:competence/damage-inducible protein A [Candidatus Kurthia intestinigallinarum]